MKPKNTFLNFLIITSSSLLALTSASAQLTWDANDVGADQTDGAGGWLDALHWWDGATNVDWVSGSDAIFGNSGTAGNVTLASPTAVGSITFNDFSGTYNLGTAGQMLTINSGITINAGSGAVSFLGPITLGGAQTWTNNSTGSLSTGRNTNLIDNGGFQLTVDGTGVTSFGTINNAEVALTGSGNLVKNGSGRLNIGGVNSGFTGTVTLNGGVTQVTNNAGALGDGNVTLNGGVISFYWSTNYNRTLGTGNNQVQILGGESGFAGSGTNGPNVNLGSTVMWGANGEGSGATGFFNPGKFVLGDEGTGNAANTTFSSGIDLNGGTRTIKVPSGLSSGKNRPTISGAISNSTGTGNLIFEVDGVLTLSNNSSSWNGSTAVSGSGIVNFGGINEDNIGGGSARNISVAAGSAIRFNAVTNAVLNRIVETTDEIGIMTGGGSADLDFSSSVTGANLSNAFLGNWLGNNGKATYSGTITAGSNGYKLGATGSSGLLGITSVLSGANDLTVGGTGASGIRVNLVAANTHTGETVINTGAKLTIGNNLALQNSALNVGAAGGNFALAAGTNGGRITGETAAASPIFGGLIGSRNLSSVFTTSGGNNETNLTANLITGFTLNVADGNTFTYSGAIGGFGTGTTNNNGGGTGGDSTLTKTGLGTQILSGASTYIGVTTVSEGTLLINGSGSISAGSAVTVEEFGAIGGTGSILSTLSMSTGSSFHVVDLVDALVVAGTVSIYSGFGVDNLVGLDWSTVDAGTYTLIDGTLGGGVFDGLNHNSFATAYDAGFGRTAYFQEGSLQLVVDVIPEPSAALLGGLGLFVLLRRRRA